MRIPRVFSSIIASIWFISSIVFAEDSTAQSDTRFFCGYSSDGPATIADTPRGHVPVIIWVSNYFQGSGYDPLTRCKQVSARFELYHKSNQLEYLTTGYENGQDIICTATSFGGECQALLFTLKPVPGKTSDDVLEELRNRRAISGSPPLYETSQRVYIDMSEFLAIAPVQPTQESLDSKTSIIQNRSTKVDPISQDKSTQEAVDPLW